jgi:glutaredoxin
MNENKPFYKKYEKTIAIVVILLLSVIAVGLIVVYAESQKEVKYDEKTALAEKLTTKGWVLFSMTTCPHCIQQKEAFGDQAVQFLDVINCDASEFNMGLCKANNISAVPTWYNVETGETLLGFRTLTELEERL